jgi:hypothetical protein
MLSAVSASADSFTLPSSAGSPNPGCGPLDNTCDAIASGSLVSKPGSFNINESGDVNACGVSFDCATLANPNKLCYPLGGTVSLTFGADVLVLVSSPINQASNPAGDTLCATETAQSGGWPLELTFKVDPIASQGIYHLATGSGSLIGTWDAFNPTICGTPCGSHLSESLAFNYTNVSIPNLALDTSGGGCDPANPLCGNPGGGATPELDSILLFGSGLSGFVAYAVRRRRAGKLRS